MLQRVIFCSHICNRSSGNLAGELGPRGIRVNTVNPDAVLRGSKIMSEGFRMSRAQSLGIKPGSKEFHALKRSQDLYGPGGKGKGKGRH